MTAVCPGPVDTEFFDHTGKEVASVKKKFRAAWVASKIVPDSVIVAVMEKIAE